jgi:hypothetical protein
VFASDALPVSAVDGVVVHAKSERATKARIESERGVMAALE